MRSAIKAASIAILVLALALSPTVYLLHVRLPRFVAVSFIAVVFLAILVFLYFLLPNLRKPSR